MLKSLQVNLIIFQESMIEIIHIHLRESAKAQADPQYDPDGSILVEPDAHLLSVVLHVVGQILDGRPHDAKWTADSVVPALLVF